jgi:hypothetical protein
MIQIMTVPSGMVLVKIVKSPLARKILKHTAKVIVVILIDEAFKKRES